VVKNVKKNTGFRFTKKNVIKKKQKLLSLEECVPISDHTCQHQSIFITTKSRESFI